MGRCATAGGSTPRWLDCHRWRRLSVPISQLVARSNGGGVPSLERDFLLWGRVQMLQVCYRPGVAAVFGRFCWARGSTDCLASASQRPDHTPLFWGTPPLRLDLFHAFLMRSRGLSLVFSSQSNLLRHGRPGTQPIRAAPEIHQTLLNPSWLRQTPSMPVPFCRWCWLMLHLHLHLQLHPHPHATSRRLGSQSVSHLPCRGTMPLVRTTGLTARHYGIQSRHLAQNTCRSTRIPHQVSVMALQMLLLRCTMLPRSQ